MNKFIKLNNIKMTFHLFYNLSLNKHLPEFQFKKFTFCIKTHFYEKLETFIKRSFFYSFCSYNKQTKKFFNLLYNFTSLNSIYCIHVYIFFLFSVYLLCKHFNCTVCSSVVEYHTYFKDN